jgi:hypothetical protein
MRLPLGVGIGVGTAHDAQQQAAEKRNGGGQRIEWNMALLLPPRMQARGSPAA